MNILAHWLTLTAVFLSTALAPASGEGGATTLTLAGGDGGTTATSCLYPSAHQRFGVSVGGDINQFDVADFPSGSYLDWSARPNPPHPNAMIYYPMVYPTPNGYWPDGATLAAAVRGSPGATWMIGNETETVWQGNLTPEQYARAYHDATTAIRELDPTARFAFTSPITVSTLRLAWLDRALAAYRSMYGDDPQVDVWTVHTYLVNEMAREWGGEIPTGIQNAVGYHYRGAWAEATMAGASGGTVHESRQPNARAYFAFQGSQATLYLRTGPDAGRAAIYVDERADPVETVDLYTETAGSLTRTYTSLIPSLDSRLGNRHHIRVEVTNTKHPFSTGTWVRVDALAAPSTTGLTGGRLENNDPMRARIVTDVDDHDNIAMIADQIKDFRQWMADNGQRNKPLLNSEHGILMTEDLGFDYPRVRTFMLNSFDLFVNDLKDPQLGLPEDDNRMLQEWLWFALNQDTFEGRVVHTGLYSDATKEIKSLGQDFANYVLPLVQSYVDLETTRLSLTPTWPLFDGDQSLVQVEAEIVNRGIAASGPFMAELTEGSTVAGSWPVASLAKRFEVGDRAVVAGEWRPVISGSRTVALMADNPQQTTDNCRANNLRSATLETPPFTDLAVSNLRTDPQLLPPVSSRGTMTPTLHLDVLNLGSQGTKANQIRVRFWDADAPPASSDALLKTIVLGPGLAPGLLTLTFEWPDLRPGVYNLAVTVDGAPEDTNLDNNRQTLRFMVPASNVYFPHYLSRYRAPRTLNALSADFAPSTASKAISGAWFLPQ